MNRQTTTTLVVVALAALIILAIPWATGLIFKHKFGDFVDDWSQASGMPVDIVSYHEGWFRSRAITRVELTANDSLRVKHVITHNPLMTLAFAVIRSTPQTDEAAAMHRRKLFSGKPPWTAMSRVYFSGAADVQITSPAMTQPLPINGGGAELVWQGLNGQIHINDAGLSYDARLPDLGIRTSDAEIRLHHVTLKGSMAAATTRTDTQFSAEQLRISTANGETEMAVKSAAHGDIDDNGLFNANYTLDIKADDTGNTESTDTALTLRHASLDASLSGVPSAALRVFLSRLEENRNSPSPQSIKPLILEYLPQLFTDSTELHINIPAFASNKGNLEAHASAQLGKQTSGKALLAIMQWARRLNIVVKLDTDKQLASYMAGDNAVQLLPALVNQHVLVAKDGRYHVVLRLNGMRDVTVNGHPARHLWPLLGRILAR